MKEENTRPFFSIVVPCKNSASTLERTLLSILAQEVDLEVIIVDGASTDGTLSLLQKYQSDSRVKIDSKLDSGIYSGINRGIAQTRGNYVGILNADDAYTDGALSQVQEALQGGADFCYGPVWWFNPRRSERILIAPLKREEWLIKGLQQMPAPHVAIFLKKEKYETLGTYSEDFKIAADHEFLLRLAKSKCSSVELTHPIAELLSGGVSAGILAKRESCKIAQNYGRNVVFAFLVFLRQVTLSYIFGIISPSRILRWNRNSRYQTSEKGVQ